MTAPISPSIRPNPDSRLRAYGHFLVALFYFFMARALAHRGALGLSNDQWSPLVEQAMLAFLLIFGYAGFGFTLNRQQHPIGAQGLPARPGWPREFAVGLSIGWGIAAVCVLAMALFGGIVVGLSFSLSAWGWLLADAAFFALMTLAEEVAFRGYAFQRFARATGPAGAIFGFSLLYAFLESMRPGATHSTAAVAFLFSVLLSTAYLRTQALWVSWGINFGWKATRAILFGLAVHGDSTHSPILQGDPTGAFWLTGGGYGLESSWLTLLVLLLALPIVFRATRDLDFRYNAPEIIPGGIPVDIDAATRRQHEAAMGPSEPAPPTLIQIGGIPANAGVTRESGITAPETSPTPSETGNETP
ncbi:MAG TPA: CPBP family intramembrane glutamic endopeptidase [Terracidiphilus sp.]|nr:CPBP family intramembrane glutamic endopeptidase [Terracidiphilus sp.]